MKKCPFLNDVCIQNECMLWSEEGKNCLLAINLLNDIVDESFYSKTGMHVDEELPDNDVEIRESSRAAADYITQTGEADLANELVEYALGRAPSKRNRIWVPNIAGRFWASKGVGYRGALSPDVQDKMSKVEQLAQTRLDDGRDNFIKSGE
jgi:hypothetical protein